MSVRRARREADQKKSGPEEIACDRTGTQAVEETEQRILGTYSHYELAQTMNLLARQSQIERYFTAHAADFGLATGQVRAEYVLNWGGFGNQSFTVMDGRRQLHLKLSDDPENRRAMRRWHALHPHLEQHYHSPPVLAWVDLSDTDFEGLLFERIDGETLAHLSPELARSILPVIQRLHSDQALAQRLRDLQINPSQPPLSCRQTYLGTYHDRFTEDLHLVAQSPPPFVDEAFLAWLSAEVAELESLVCHTASFDEVVTSVIHGDLWVNNLLVTKAGAWFLLDWDSLGIGDPALDLALLFGPSAARLRPVPWQQWPEPPQTRALQERLDVYARASLLDWVIDVLADYVAADAAPVYASQVRAEKERHHREALSLYRETYG